jgi:thiosulfate dehydrogenase [quinone] large subunit
LPPPVFESGGKDTMKEPIGVGPESWEGPRLAKSLLGSPRWGWLWLIVRLYVGWQWLTSGWEKLNDPAWVGGQAGASLTGFLQHSLTLTTGAHPSVQPWYAWFVEHSVLPQVVVWSYAVSIGEFLVGLGLLTGILTGLAAFFGGLMNFNYLLAGSVSINPVMLVLEIGLMLAWRNAGWWGGDRWLLPALRKIRLRR